MNRALSQKHRGLSLLELMIALVITALIAGAISGMMGAVSAGVSTRRDSRGTMVGANAAATRLGAYIAPARCILDDDGTNLAIWFTDSRESNTVHVTEVRWLVFDDSAGSYDVHFISFPKGWAQAAKDLEDQEYPPGSNWTTILNTYAAKNWTVSMPLVDGLDNVSVSLNQFDPQDSEHASFELGFVTTAGVRNVAVAATIRDHRPPSS